MRPRLLPKLLPLLLVTATAGVAGEMPARAAEPAVSLSSTSVRPGTKVVVTLQGWDVGEVTVSVCGNEARRGSPDCDLVGSVAAGPFQGGRPELVEMVVHAPPAPCPCLVRAATRASQVVRTTPLILEGHPVAPVVGPAPPASPLAVTARVRPAKSGLTRQVRSWFGGPTPRLLDLEIRNRGATVLNQISINAAVGRDRQGGAPLPIPDVAPLRPGEVRRYTVPVVLPAPAHGRYVVFGSVFGPGEPVRFDITTSTTPGLLLASVVALALVGLIGAGTRLRAWRGGREPVAAPPAPTQWLPVELQVTSEETGGEHSPQPVPIGAELPKVTRVTSDATRPAVSTRPRTAGPPVLFRSRRAAYACAAATALFLLVVFATAGCSDSTKAGEPAKPDVPATAGSGRLRFETEGIPARVEITGTSGVTDGQEVKVTAAAKEGSQIFGFEAFLCRADATFHFDADVRPTQIGKCVAEPLSPNSDSYVEARAEAPFQQVEGTFRVGAGTSTYTRDDGKPVTITCGPGSECRIVLKLQYPDGFGFVSQAVDYR